MTLSDSDEPTVAQARDTIIALKDLRLTLGSEAGEVNILRGIDLTVGSGETVSIVGPSGSGKTSMLMVIAGLERASGGQVTIGEKDFTRLSEDQLALFRRDNLGIVFQSFHLVPTMSALENVAIPLELAGRRDAFDRSRALLERVGLGHRLTHYPGQLSGGEQQRVALARAFVAEPKLILADEPTGNLDAGTGQQVIDLMFEMSDHQDTTLMLITHDPALAKRCRRVVRMGDGVIEEDSISSDAARQAAE
ncbi:ABC transporter ATP-binding protein [Hwanghaeella sp.]|uniref:ABC transporter ATP-binding protein n=1 Tax=Hwanghaeella sp. TaxID=2605943 RepID=UPI003CCC243B